MFIEHGILNNKIKYFDKESPKIKIESSLVQVWRGRIQLLYIINIFSVLAVKKVHPSVLKYLENIIKERSKQPRPIYIQICTNFRRELIWMDLHRMLSTI